MRLNRLLFFLGLCIGALIISVFYIRAYPTLYHLLMPDAPEAESLVYVLCAATFILFSLCFYWLSYTNLSKRIIELTYNFSQKIHILYLGVAFALTVFIFRNIVVFTQTKPAEDVMYVIGITAVPHYVSFSFGIFFLVILLLFSLLFFGKPTPKIHWVIFDAIACMCIIVLTFFVARQLNPRDYATYAGPAYTILKGRAPLDTPFWYGFLSIVTLTTFFRFIPMTLLNLHVYFAVWETVGFLLIYWILILMFKDRRWAFMTELILIIFSFISMYSYYPDISSIMRNYNPQLTFYRFGWFIPVLFGIYFSSQNNHNLLYFLKQYIVAVLAIVGVFWVFDGGLYAFAAFILYRTFFLLDKSMKKTFINILKLMIQFAGLFLLIFFLITICYEFWYNQKPGWISYMSFIASRLNSSITLLPFPHSILPWIVLVIPGISIIYMLTRKRFVSQLHTSEQLILFLSLYALTTYTYFTGRSTFGTLQYVFAPSIIISVWLGREYISRYLSQKVYAFSYIMLFSFIVALVLFPKTIQAINNYKRENFLTTISQILHPVETEENMFGTTVQMIKSKYDGYLANHNPAVISVWDAWYLLLFGKSNALPLICLFCQIYNESLQPTVDYIVSQQPEYIFIDTNTAYNMSSRIGWIMSHVLDRYTYSETLGYLDIFRRVR